jgi:hypothetical protein
MQRAKASERSESGAVGAAVRSTVVMETLGSREVGVAGQDHRLFAWEVVNRVLKPVNL